MEIKGDFEAAVIQLISDIKANTFQGKSKSAYQILSDWDRLRGNDWFTSTKKWEEQSEAK